MDGQGELRLTNARLDLAEIPRETLTLHKQPQVHYYYIIRRS